MAEDLHDDLVLEKRKQSSKSPWIFLAEVWIDTTNAIRLASYTANVTWESNVYYAAPITLSSFTTGTDNAHSDFTVTVADVDGRVGAYVKAYEGLRGKECRFYIVNSAQLSDGYAWRAISEIKSAKVTSEGTAFAIGTIDILTREGPRGTFQRGRCINEFGGRRGREGRCGFDTSLPGAPQACTRKLKGPGGCMEKAAYASANGLPNRWPGAYMGFEGILLPKQ